MYACTVKRVCACVRAHAREKPSAFEEVGDEWGMVITGERSWPRLPNALYCGHTASCKVRKAGNDSGEITFMRSRAETQHRQML